MPHIERLTTRIVHPHDPTPSTEDIFCSALESLFTDDTRQSHGVPGRSIIYRSPRFGDVYLLIPSHPDEKKGRLLFAHCLWNAAVIAAEAIERASCDEDEDDDVNGEGVEVRLDKEVSTSNGNSNTEELVHWDKRFWDMRDMDVLELGADELTTHTTKTATALPSLISTLSNAHTVTSTDHPSSPAITTNAIALNFQINITDRKTTTTTTNPPTTQQEQEQEHKYTDEQIPTLHHPPISTTTSISIHGYTWGTMTFYSSHKFGEPSTPQPPHNSFDKIIIADCLWMPEQHENLVMTILTYLKEDKDKENEKQNVPCALVIAGFHTGRAVVRDFVQIAIGSALKDDDRENGREDEVKGRLKAVEIFEVDVNGRRRSWQPERPNETKEQSKRWCMCAVLVTK